MLRREAATRIRLLTDRRCRELPIRRPSQPQCEPPCWQRPDGTQIVTNFLAIKEQLSETDSGSQFAHLECVASDAHVLRTQLLGADRPLFLEAELDAWGRPRTDGRRPHISTDAPW